MKLYLGDDEEKKVESRFLVKTEWANFIKLLQEPVLFFKVK